MLYMVTFTINIPQISPNVSIYTIHGPYGLLFHSAPYVPRFIFGLFLKPFQVIPVVDLLRTWCCWDLEMTVTLGPYSLRAKRSEPKEKRCWAFALRLQSSFFLWCFLEISKYRKNMEASIFVPGLVNVYKKIWKDPPCYFHGKIHYFNGHFQ